MRSKYAPSQTNIRAITLCIQPAKTLCFMPRCALALARVSVLDCLSRLAPEVVLGLRSFVFYDLCARTLQASKAESPNRMFLKTKRKHHLSFPSFPPLPPQPYVCARWLQVGL